ncbi:hypothetical protein [Actinoalloteichus caeruleus]|uniref:hypothetical protein n=1 Tax=Actinoalloteichus cyanogriseus TaxID=2893586 RepID=UPI0012DD5208|nr:hypothetical protein [Actinoalloteichus caeruleus]
MTTITSLIHARPNPNDSIALSELDPLRKVDALQEAQLLDSKVCHVTSTAALLLEMRTALEIDTGNFALLVVRRTETLTWTMDQILDPFMAVTIISSLPHSSNNSFGLHLGFIPDGHLTLVGERADFYLLDVEEISETIPDYTEVDIKELSSALPSWSSKCNLLGASYLG